MKCIFNLTDISFTQEELLVLSEGLKFSPVKFLDKFETYIDLEKFARKLDVKKLFEEHPSRKDTGSQYTYNHTD